MSLSDLWDNIRDAGEEIIDDLKGRAEERFDRIKEEIGDQLEKVEKYIPFSVNPVPGSVVYCKLLTAHHSGVYLGDGRIAHLDGDGSIQSVTPRVFIDRLNGWNTGLLIYVSCCNGQPIGCKNVATRAKKMIGKRREYNFILDNCHQFTAGCLTGSFDNPINFFWMLREKTNDILGADSWRSWDLDAEELF